MRRRYFGAGMEKSAAAGGGGDPIGDALRADAMGYWKMDEASGNRLDSTGKGHHFAPNNAVAQGAGKIGNAVQVDGSVSYSVNEQYLSTDAHADLTGGDDQDFTIAGWIYVTSYDYDTPSFFSKENNGIEYNIIVDSGGTPRLGLQIGYNNIYLAKDTETVIDPGTWYFFVAWQDTQAQKQHIQVNGGSIYERAWSSGPPGQVTDPTASVMVGAEYIPNPYDFLDGRVDEIGFWHRILTADERAYLYNSGNGRTLYP